MTIFHTAAALAAALLVAPADAQDRGGAASRQVVHADLDLRDAGDVRRLDLRIVHTARTLCGEASPHDMVGRRKIAQCVDAAVARVADARARAIGTAGATMVAGR